MEVTKQVVSESKEQSKENQQLALPDSVENGALTKLNDKREFVKIDRWREMKEKLGFSNPKYKTMKFNIASNMKSNGVTFLDVSKELGDVEEKGYHYFFLVGVIINGTWLVPEKVKASAVFALFDTRIIVVDEAKVACVSAKPKQGDFRMAVRPNYGISIRDFKRTSWALAHWIESNSVRHDVDVTACEVMFIYSLAKGAIMNSLKEGLTDADFDDTGRISGTLSEDKFDAICNDMAIQSQLRSLGINKGYKKKNKMIKDGEEEEKSNVRTQLERKLENSDNLS